MLRKTIIALAGAAVLAASGSAIAQQKLILGSNQGPPTGFGIALLDHFIPRVAKYSVGTAVVEFDGPSAICVEHQCVEQMQQDLIQISTSSTENIGAFGRTYDVINLPYFFRDLEWADMIFNGWLADWLDKTSRKDMNVGALAVVPCGGFRQLANNVRRVKAPADLKGIKIRVTKSPSAYELIKGWGGIAVPYDWAQLYQGMQSGVVNGFYIPDGWTVHVKLNEVAPYITEMGGAYTGCGLWISDKHQKTWPQGVQDAVIQAGKDIQAGMVYEIDRQWLKTATIELKKCCDVYYPTDEEMLEWFTGSLSTWVEAKNTYPKEIAERALLQQGMDEFVAVLKENGAL
jgi:TRAP-type C4-dicarboxylate transport system substrate-binding protein